MDLQELKFRVDTKELDDAITKVGQLGDAVSKINSPVSELAKNTKDAAKGAAELSAAASKTSSSTKDLGDNTDAVNARLQKLKDQLAFLRNDLNLSETGLTKMQAGLLASMKAIGATDAQLKQFASTFDQFNRLMGEQALDKSVAGLNMLNRQLREFEITNQLAAKGFNLTSTQIKQLSRDIEALRQQNEEFGRSADDGVDQLVNKYVAAANAVNKYIAAAKEAEQAARREAQAAIAAAKAKEEHNAAIERQYALVRQSAWKEYAASIGKQSEEMQKLSAYYREQERAAEALDAQRINEAAKANQYLTRETEKLVFINEKLAQGFSTASANALFKYQEALLKTGRTADQVEKELRDLGAELMKKQGTSPISVMQKDIQQLDQSVNHLARNIGVQFTDIFVSLANGQSVLQVVTQQGGQLADAFLLAGISGKNMTNQLVEGAKSIFASYKVLVSAFLDLGGRAIKGAGESVVRFASQITGTDLVINTFKRNLASLGEEGFQYIGVVNKIGAAMSVFAGIVVSTVVVALGALLAAFVQLSREQDVLAKSLAQYGANFGATAESAAELSRSLVDLGVKSSDAVTVIAEMAKAGNLGKESFEGIAVAATNAQKYVGIAVADTVKNFSELVKDPVKVLTEFGKQTGFVSQEQIKLVQDLIKVGATTDATKEAIKILENGYLQMASSAKENTSALGLAMISLKSAVSDVWNEFKNSSAVVAAIKYVSYSIRGLGALIALAAAGAKSLMAVLAAQKNIVFDPLNAKKHFNDLTESLGKYQKEYNDTIDALSAKNKDLPTAGLSAEQRAANAEAIRQAERGSQIQKEITGTVQSRVKELSKEAYVQERLNEIMKGYAVNSSEGLKLFSQARLKAEKEWEDANKSSTQKAINGTEKLDNQYKKILESFVKITSEAEDYNDQLTKAQVKLNEVLRGDTWKKLSDEQKASLLLEYERAHAAELVKKKLREEIQEREKLRQENFKYLSELEDAYEKLTKDLDNQTEKLKGISKDLEFQFSLIGKSAKEQELLTREYERQKKIKEAELELEKQLAEVRKLEASGLYTKEAEEKREQAEKNFAEKVRQINEETALKAVRDYQKAFEEIQNTITDIIATALFEGGKAGQKKLKDLLKAEFRNFVINVLINPVVKGGMNAILGAIGTGSSLGSVGSALLGSTGTGGFLGSIGSVVSEGINRYLSNTAIGTLLSSPIGYAAAIGGGSIAAGSQAAMLAAQTGGFGVTGTALTAQAAGGVAGSVASGAMSAMSSIAAAAPYVAAGVAVLSALGAFRSKKIVGGGLMGTLGEGDIKSYDLQRKGGSLFSGPSYSIKNVQTSPMSKALQDAFDAMRKAAAGMAEQLGIAGDQFLTFTTRLGDDLIHPDTGGYGLNLYGLNEQQRQEAVEKALAKANDKLSLEVLRKAALSDLGTARQDAVDNYLKQFTREGETASQTLVRLTTSLQVVNSGFDLLNATLLDASLRNADLASSLIDVFGGIENFNSATRTYFKLFYSEEEQLAEAVESMNEAFSALGLTMPQTKKQFRDLVEAQDLTTESGRKTYVALLNMAEAFDAVQSSADGISRTLKNLADQVTAVFSPLRDQIASVHGSVTSSIDSIRGRAVMTPDQIRSAIQGAMLTPPTTTGLNAAAAQVSAAQAHLTQMSSASAQANAVRDQAQARLNDLQAALGSAQEQLASLEPPQNQFIRVRSGFLGLRRKTIERSGYQQELAEFYQRSNELRGQIDSLSVAVAQQQSTFTAAAESAKFYAQQLEAAKAALTAAQDAQVAAQEEYARGVRQFIIDAGKSVEKLGDLRQSVIAYYESQRKLAEAMLGSAERLRDVVNAVRFGQLSRELLPGQLMAQFQQNYSMALATTDLTRAQYADRLADSLPQLSDSLRAAASSREEWILATARLVAQANTVASLLEQTAPQDYQQQSLDLLGDIDRALSSIEVSAASAEKAISDAIYETGAQNLTGLRAIVATLRGESVPRFALGGQHTGGIRLVGENGPELEVTGPARYWSFSQTRRMMDSGNSAEVVEAIKALNENISMLRAEVRADVSHNAKIARILDRAVQEGDALLVSVQS